VLHGADEGEAAIMADYDYIIVGQARRAERSQRD
jgi:hypothetical protein